MSEKVALRERASVFYTSIRGDEVDGFQIAATSEELNAEARRAIELHSAANGRDLEGPGSAVRYYRAGERWAVTRVVPAAADYTGREGNVLAHTILLEPDDLGEAGFSVGRLVEADLFVDALPDTGSAPPPVVLPAAEPERTYRLRPLDALFGSALPEVIGWLAAGKRVAVAPAAEQRLTVEPCETLRLLLQGEAQETFTFSTLNDNPALRRYSVCGLLDDVPPDSVASWRSRDPELAVFSVAEQRWLAPPQFGQDQGALEYGRQLVSLLTARRLPSARRLAAARQFQAYIEEFGSTGQGPLLARERVLDAGELLRVQVGLIETDRPQLKRLRCLLPYVRSSRVVQELDDLLPSLVAEALQQTDPALIVNACRVLLQRKEKDLGEDRSIAIVRRQALVQHLALKVAKGVERAWQWAGPLWFEFKALAAQADVPSAAGNHAEALIRDRSRSGGWSFSAAGVASLARFGASGDLNQRVLAFRFLQDLLAQAAQKPSLLGTACDALGEHIATWIPDDRLPIDALVELFARGSEDLGPPHVKELRQIVERVVLTGHSSALALNAKRLLKAGLPARDFIDACVLLDAPELLVRHAARLPTEDVFSLARATQALLKRPDGRELLPQWLKRIPYEALPPILEHLEAARESLAEDRRFLPNLGLPLRDRDRAALVVALEERVEQLGPNSTSPLVTRALVRQVRRLVGWKTLLRGEKFPRLGLAARFTIVEPRLEQCRAVLLAAVSTVAAVAALTPLLLPVPPLGTALGAFIRDGLLPFAAFLLLVSAWRWDCWNERVGDPWEDLAAHWRFRAAGALRPLAVVVLSLWVIFQGRLLTGAPWLPELPLAQVGADVPPILGPPLTGAALAVLSGLLAWLVSRAEGTVASLARVGWKLAAAAAVGAFLLLPLRSVAGVSERLPAGWREASADSDRSNRPSATPTGR